MKKYIYTFAAIILVLLIGIFVVNSGKANNNKKEIIKIGVVTDLTGPVAYYGESTRDGALYAKKVLAEKGIQTDILIEDFHLLAPRAANATHKLVYADGVQGMYVETNPGVVAANSILKNTKLPYIYNAAVESLLKDNEMAYKTYLDYRSGCESLASDFKKRNIEKVGVLKMNMEFADICLDGIKKIYPDVVVEPYNLGDSDIRTQMHKLQSQNIGAIINVGFEGDIFNALKILSETKSQLLFGTVSDSVTDSVKENFKGYLPKVTSFGFSENLDKNFLSKVEKFTGRKLTSGEAAISAYTHIIQLAEAINKCGDDSVCIKTELDKPVEKNSMGFEGFVNHIGKFNQVLETY